MVGLICISVISVIVIYPCLKSASISDRAAEKWAVRFADVSEQVYLMNGYVHVVGYK